MAVNPYVALIGKLRAEMSALKTQLLNTQVELTDATAKVAALESEKTQLENKVKSLTPMSGISYPPAVASPLGYPQPAQVGIGDVRVIATPQSEDNYFIELG